MDNISSFSKKSNELIMKGAMKQPLKDLKLVHSEDKVQNINQKTAYKYITSVIL